MLGFRWVKEIFPSLLKQKDSLNTIETCGSATSYSEKTSQQPVKPTSTQGLRQCTKALMAWPTLQTFNTSCQKREKEKHQAYSQTDHGGSCIRQSS